MSYKRSRLARSWLRSFLYFVFSKCGHCISRKIIPFSLSFVVLGLSFAVPSYAANTDGNMDFYASQSSLDVYYIDPSTGNNVSLSPTTSVINWKNKEAFRIACPTAPGNSSGQQTPIRIVQSFVIPNLNANHEYTLDFWYAYNERANAICNVVLEVFDGNGNVLKSQILYPGDSSVLNDTWTECNISFKPDLSGITSGYTTKLSIYLMQTRNVNNWTVHLSNYIYFNDNDDDTGLLNSILNWLSRIYHSIAGGTDREGVTHTGLVQGISNALTNLGNRISGFFADLKQGFLDKLEAVKNSINNAIAGIQQWFIDLKDNIINGLKSLFIPHDGYFAEKKTQLETFATQHFGALYQGPDIMIDLIRKLLTVDPSENPGITMPAIEFDFQGQHYTLTEAIHYSFSWVNDSSHPVYYFYHIYRGFVTVILFVGFGNYLIKKYRDVFEGGGDGE